MKNLCFSLREYWKFRDAHTFGCLYLDLNSVGLKVKEQFHFENPDLQIPHGWNLNSNPIWYSQIMTDFVICRTFSVIEFKMSLVFGQWICFLKSESNV